jgi:outer membrane autotransporter protein
MDQGRLPAGAVRHGCARRRLGVALLASSSALAILAAAPVAQAQAITRIDLGDHGTLIPEVRVGWSHEFLDASQTLTAQLAGTAASPFTVVGTSFGRDSAVVGVGVSHEFAPGASFFVDYDGQFTGSFNQNSGSVGIRVRF